MRLGLGLIPALLLASAVRTDAASPVSVRGELLGSVAIRSAGDLRRSGKGSLLSIGAETTDRNFSRYENWAAYLGPLGIPSVRFQSGWADIERERGRYDFAKLETMVRGAKADGVQPWIDLAYGNPLYRGGGDRGLGAGIPKEGTPGYEAWFRFVDATVRHFARRDIAVDEWKIWNEPDGGPNSPEEFARFAARTALTVKRAQPRARILVAGFASHVFGKDREFAIAVIERFAQLKDPTIRASDVTILYHPYAANPDTTYVAPFTRLRDTAARHGFAIMQGENGTNSRAQPHFALHQFQWDEASQAKWILRRSLGDLHRGIRTNIFTLTDLHYDRSKNNKGLLETGDWAPEGPYYGDQRVKRPKISYRAVQAMAAIFDDNLRGDQQARCEAPAGYTVQAYRRQGSAKEGALLLAIWRSSDQPGLNPHEQMIDIRCAGARFGGDEQRFVELLDGTVARAVRGAIRRSPRGGVVIRNVPVTDSPRLIADAMLVPASPAGR